MKIDHLIIESLQAWGRTWTSGRPVRIEIRQNEDGKILCDVYSRLVCSLSELHPLTTTEVSTVIEADQVEVL